MSKHKRPFNPRGLSGKHPKEHLGVSWWADHARPGQRESFIVAAKQRAIDRVEKFTPSYANADGAIDK